jgi:hypothetical protein
MKLSHCESICKVGRICSNPIQPCYSHKTHWRKLKAQLAMLGLYQQFMVKLGMVYKLRFANITLVHFKDAEQLFRLMLQVLTSWCRLQHIPPAHGESRHEVNEVHNVEVSRAASCGCGPTGPEVWPKLAQQMLVTQSLPRPSKYHKKNGKCTKTMGWNASLWVQMEGLGSCR